ncbi:MAG: glycoside hydrolase family 3 protein [Treponema sp.]|nr:glycoside hydrolase family 3 protein [Treponema sp.]
MKNQNLSLSLIVCLVCALLFSCKKNPGAEEIARQKAEAIELAKEAAVSEYVSSLSTEAKISQIFLVNIEGNSKYSAVEQFNGKPLVPGGVLLFSYNISNDPLETYDYIKSIRDFYLQNDNPPPFVAVDQEGGYVNRLRNLTSPLVSQKMVADTLSLENAEKLYSSQARQMKNLGFHLNLAPVVEVETDENKDFLDTRSFGSLEKVLSYGKIAVEAYEKNGIATVLKHFPGNSNADPHVGLPKITFSDSEKEKYFTPFRKLLPLSSAILMSHAIMKPEITENDGNVEKYELPACFSTHWIQNTVKSEFGFSGLVFSDDIFMGALAKNGYPPEIASVKAIESGIDVIMLSEKKFGSVLEILSKKAGEDENFSNELDRAVKNVIRFKIKFGILEMTENPVPENEIPAFKVQVKPDYAEFDLKKFDEDYKAGSL